MTKRVKYIKIPVYKSINLVTGDFICENNMTIKFSIKIMNILVVTVKSFMVITVNISLDVSLHQI